MTDTILARPLPNIRVVETTAETAKTVTTGGKPFTTETKLRSYDILSYNEVIGDFHSYPVEDKTGYVSIAWAGRPTHLVPPNTAYVGGYLTREDTVDAVLIAYYDALSQLATQASVTSPYRYVVRENRAREWVAYINFNGETIFWSGGYQKQESAIHALSRFHKSIQGTPFVVEKVANARANL